MREAEEKSDHEIEAAFHQARQSFDHRLAQANDGDSTQDFGLCSDQRQGVIVRHDLNAYRQILEFVHNPFYAFVGSSRERDPNFFDLLLLNNAIQFINSAYNRKIIELLSKFRRIIVKKPDKIKTPAAEVKDHLRAALTQFPGADNKYSAACPGSVAPDKAIVNAKEGTIPEKEKNVDEKEVDDLKSGCLAEGHKQRAGHEDRRHDGADENPSCFLIPTEHILGMIGIVESKR